MTMNKRELILHSRPFGNICLKLAHEICAMGLGNTLTLADEKLLFTFDVHIWSGLVTNIYFSQTFVERFIYLLYS